MPINNFIIVLSNSTLDFDSSILQQLWMANDSVPEQVIDLLLTALENSPVDHPEILDLLLGECGKATFL